MDHASASATARGAEDAFYYPNATDRVVRLVRDPAKFSVRFGLERAPLSPEAQALLRTHAAPVAEVDGYGITVYELDSEQQKDAINLLNRERDVDLAAPVLHRERQQTDDVYLTRHFVVQFLPDVTRERIDSLNAESGVQIVEPLGYAPNGFLLRAPAGADGLGAVRTANAYRATGLTIFSHPDLVSKRHKRRAPAPAAPERAVPATRDADYLARQWHLSTARVTDAWSLTRGVPSITVAILDDGVDLAHPEFGGKVAKQFDFTTHVADGTPRTNSDNHGTACAGVAVAKGLRASGAAPGCSLMVGRFPAALGDADEAKMFQWAADNHADVISCSWGPADNTGNTDPLPGSTQAAIAYCVHSGRGGKGIPVCFAAGNGNESVDLDGYASNPDVMAIAASNDHEVRSWYSDHGDAIWICAPSSGDRNAGEKAILTTDRLGPAGYNSGSDDVDADYTSTFGGTSSASPLVAGVIGLMLAANPNLTVAEVRDILRASAHKIGTGYDASGHSPDYGYGRVDAFEAVRAAQAAASGGTTPARSPSIVALSSSVDRSGPAPRFDIDPGSGPMLFYAVEVARLPELFDDTNHGAERTSTSFYASWQDSPLLASNPYQLPDAAWEQLRDADALYYRAWFSTSNTAWVDVVVTTADEDSAFAPSISITQGDRTRDAPPRRDAAVTHAGLDRLSYPGDDVMQDLYTNTNLAWTGFYLAPAPSQGYTGWMGKAATLRKMGWGLAPVFVGQQWPGGPGSHILTAEQGAADAERAARLADTAAIGGGAVIYLDIEIGGQLPPAFLAYAQAWFDGIRKTSYRPGVYCSYLNTPAQLRAKNPDLYFWVFNVNKFAATQAVLPDGSFRTPPIADSGCEFAIAWQYIQGAQSIPVPHTGAGSSALNTVDLNCATVLDPSFPEWTGDTANTAPETSTNRPASISSLTAELDRSGPAPRFDVDPGSGGTFYAVEVAKRAELLNAAEHTADRTPATFYGSWQTSSLLSSNPYELPSSVWEQLKDSDVLFYRALFSTSAGAWTDLAATTADADFASAPSIRIMSAASDRNAPVARSHPSISGPAEAPRYGPPPTFSFWLPPEANSYRIELASEVSLLDSAVANRRNTRNYYASPVMGRTSTMLYGLPVDVWQALRPAARLFYRIGSARSPASMTWRADDSSAPDDVVERARWLIVVGDAPESMTAHDRPRAAPYAATRVADPDELHWRGT